MQVDLIVENARVLTQDPDRPTATRFAVLRDRIVAVDDACDGLAAIRSVDLGGATVTPGFNDAHAHSVWFGQTLLEINLAGCASPEELYVRVADAAKDHPAGDWLIASGFNQMDAGGAYPDADALDQASGGRPLWIKHTSGHSCLVNRAALTVLNITGAEKIAGGLVVCDDAGRPTGRLEEHAMSLVHQLLLPLAQERIVDALAAATAVYASEGLTSVTDAGIGGGWIGNSPQEFAAYQLAAERGVLSTRMQPMLVAPVLGEVSLGHAGSFRGLPGGMRSGLGDARLQLGPTKIFLDGSILGNTARLSTGYDNCVENHGYFQGDVETMRAHALEAARAGWALAMHAVGDEAVDLAIEILQQLAAEGTAGTLPHRIEHGGVVTAAQLAALGELGVTIVAQPYFIRVYGDGFRGYVGDERAGRSFPGKSLLDQGLALAGSSDRPVATGAPLAVMQSAVQRSTASGWVYGASERITAEEALRAYTVGSAEVTGWAHEKGVIAPGFLADFTVLSDNPLAVDADRIAEIDVLATALGGRATFDPGHRFTVTS